MSSDDGLRPLFHANVAADWQAIETGMVGRGIPDSNFCLKAPHRGVEGWLECKWTDGWSVTLRPEQVAWLTRRARAGGRVFVAVRRHHAGGPRRGPPADELWLLGGGSAVELLRDGLRPFLTLPALATSTAPRGALLGRWSGGPRAWDWAAVARLMAR